VATIAWQVAETITAAVQTLARDLRLIRSQPVEQPSVVTVDLSKLDIEQDGESAST
jgi:hypothetical protein